MFLQRFLVLVVALSAGAGFTEKGSAAAPAAGGAADSRYFPAGILHATWQEFPVAGYQMPITGVVYRGLPRPTCGMPLGGLDTGCIDIEPNGMLGYATVFNHLIHPRLLYNAPFLALSVGGETRLLATDTLAKADRPVANETAVFPPTDYTPRFSPLPIQGVKLAKSIDYFGHYPIVDMEYDTDLPVQVGMRAWSPFLPGDAATSMLPAAVFEFTLRNPSQKAQRGTLVFNFPGFSAADIAEQVKSTREKQSGAVDGVLVSSQQKNGSHDMSYVLASIDGNKSIRTGGSLQLDGKAWNNVEKELPAATDENSGASLALDFEIAPGATQTRRIVLAWHAPTWNASGAPGKADAREFTHMYAKHYASAMAAADRIAKDHDTLLKRVIAWQSEVYRTDGLPGWLADCLINNLHLVTETGVWGQGVGPLSEFAEGGLFGMNECPRGCPQIECIPCSFYGNMPVVYFFPEAALSTLRGYRQFQQTDGRPPWIFGGVTAIDKKNQNPYDMTAPDKGYQTVLNAACYIVMADRYWQTCGDDKVLKDFYPSLKRANDFSMNLRPKFGLSQVMSMPEPGTDGHGLGDTEWFEAPEPGWKGYVTHAGGVRMAQVQIMRRMAEAMGDTEYVEKCDQWLTAGADVLENKLWNGRYYLNFNDPEGKTKSDLIFGYQLDGEWISDSHGVASVFPAPRMKTTLATIRDANVALSQSGATNYATPEGKAAKVGGYGTYGYFPPELMMLAMNYMYEGEREFGLELLHRCMQNIVCQWGYTWDAPNTIRGDMDTGQRHFGADYYQNMMLWFVPAALADQDMVGPTKNGGLVQRVIQAARGESPQIDALSDQ
ncbi:MAG: GH116 family glycosyl-hydrolase [Pirellulales bacterium]